LRQQIFNERSVVTAMTQIKSKVEPNGLLDYLGGGTPSQGIVLFCTSLIYLSGNCR
jgi:hypothetical protein